MFISYPRLCRGSRASLLSWPVSKCQQREVTKWLNWLKLILFGNWQTKHLFRKWWFQTLDNIGSKNNHNPEALAHGVDLKPGHAKAHWRQTSSTAAPKQLHSKMKRPFKHASQTSSIARLFRIQNKQPFQDCIYILFSYLFIHLFIYLFVCLFIYSFYLFNYLFI